MKDILIGIAYRTDEFKLIPFEKENINYEIFSPKNETDYSKYDGFYLPGGDGWYSEDIKLIKYAKENNIPILGVCLGMQEMSAFLLGEEKDITKKIKEKGYEVEKCKVSVQIADDEEKTKINKIKLIVSKTQEKVKNDIENSAENKIVTEIQKIAQDPVSLETPIGEEDDSHLGDFIQDDDSPAPQDAAAYTLLREQLEEVMKTLTPREAKVLTKIWIRGRKV